jgi:GxxExxY protein
MAAIIYKLESFEIIGACFEVYKEKGCGFLEPVYQECLELELGDRNVPLIAKPLLSLTYKNRSLKNKYQPDLVCHDKIVVELKAVTGLAGEHRAQVHNYLRATKMKLGLLVSFGHYPKVEYERIMV